VSVTGCEVVYERRPVLQTAISLKVLADWNEGGTRRAHHRLGHGLRAVVFVSHEGRCLVAPNFGMRSIRALNGRGVLKALV